MSEQKGVLHFLQHTYQTKKGLSVPLRAFIPNDDLEYLRHEDQETERDATKVELKLGKVVHPVEGMNLIIKETLDDCLELADQKTTQILNFLDPKGNRKDQITNSEIVHVAGILESWKSELFINKVKDSLFGMELPLMQFQLAQGASLGFIDTEKKILKILKDKKALKSTQVNLGDIDNLAPPAQAYLERRFEKFLVDLKTNSQVIYAGSYDRALNFDLKSFIEKTLGVMAAWWWWRWLRTYLPMAFAYGFDKLALFNTVKYEEWVARMNACFLCWALHGQVWEVGHGPTPIISTHAHCMCMRIPKNSTTRQVQPEYQPRANWSWL